MWKISLVIVLVRHYEKNSDSHNTLSALLISCYQKRSEITFSHTIQYDTALKCYDFFIRNNSNRNLLIFVPNVYINRGGSTGNEFLPDAPSSSLEAPYFTPFNPEAFDQTELSSALLAKTGVDWKETFKSFTIPHQNFPILLFIKSHSNLVYRYKSNKSLPKGTYRIIYDVPDFIAKSRELKEWKKELRRINNVADYFYADIHPLIDKGISFQIK